MTGLGPCMSPWCGRDATVYVAGPTYGQSPRLTVIGGERALFLAGVAGGEGVLNLRCTDCAVHALEDVAGGARRPPPARPPADMSRIRTEER